MLAASDDEDLVVLRVGTDGSRQLLSVSLKAEGSPGRPQVVRSRSGAELDDFDADETGRTLLLVWNVAGGYSEIELVDMRTGRVDVVADLPGAVVNKAVLSRDGSVALVTVEGPTSPPTVWTLGTVTRQWSAATEASGPVAGASAEPSLQFFHGRDGLPLTGWLYRAGPTGSSRGGRDRRPAAGRPR